MTEAGGIDKKRAVTHAGLPTERDGQQRIRGAARPDKIKERPSREGPPPMRRKADAKEGSRAYPNKSPSL